MKVYKYVKDWENPSHLQEMSEEVGIKALNDTTGKDYYVYDRKKNVLVLVDFGAHFVGIIAILRKFYDIKNFVAEDISTYQDYIRNMDIKGAFYSPSKYSQTIVEDGNWIDPQIKKIN